MSPETKTCSRCRQVLGLDRFRRNRSKKDGLQEWCIECKKEHDHHYFKNSPTRRQRVAETNLKATQARQRQVFEYLQHHPCVDCGEKDPVVLEFDHVRGVKKAEVATLVLAGHGWDRILQEIALCDVRCANCHRRRTAKQQNWYILSL